MFILYKLILIVIKNDIKIEARFLKKIQYYINIYNQNFRERHLLLDPLCNSIIFKHDKQMYLNCQKSQQIKFYK